MGFACGGEAEPWQHRSSHVIDSSIMTERSGGTTSYHEPRDDSSFFRGLLVARLTSNFDITRDPECNICEDILLLNSTELNPKSYS